MNTEIRLLKLTNGEDILAQVDITNPDLYHLDNPLLMKIQSKITPNGIQEGLHLSRWVQPFSEETNFSIEKQHVVLSTEVSAGLTRYYQYSIRSFEHDDDIRLSEPTNKELKQIEMEEAMEEAMNEGIEEFNEIPLQSKLIH
tara:strand:+ start:197 stop:622 length:426 start_codon:yes stop_codon:yes gene_type:complete